MSFEKDLRSVDALKSLLGHHTPPLTQKKTFEICRIWGASRDEQKVTISMQTCQKDS